MSFSNLNQDNPFFNWFTIRSLRPTTLTVLVILLSIFATGNKKVTTPLGRGSSSSFPYEVKLKTSNWLFFVRLQKTGTQTFWKNMVSSWNGMVWTSKGCDNSMFCGYKCEGVVRRWIEDTKRTSGCKLVGCLLFFPPCVFSLKTRHFAECDLCVCSVARLWKLFTDCAFKLWDPRKFWSHGCKKAKPQP